MSNAFFAEQRDRMIEAYAASMGCDASDFGSEQLTITSKPESYWPFVALIAGFGAGTVACIEERFLAWVREHAPPQHGRAGYLVLALARAAAARGETLHPMPPMLGWALGNRPEEPRAPAGYSLELVSGEWMKEWQAKDRFQNALGASMQMHRTFRNQFASVLFDGQGEPVAVAGAYDTAGLLEIGVDVAKPHRGLGLAPVVVSAVAGAILDAGKTSLYVCEVSNTRSQRTALSSGFLPTLALALAMPEGIGLADDV